MKNFLLYILILTSSFLFAQSSNKIQFQGDIISIEENINSFQWEKMPESSKFRNGYYGWIQFFETPNQAIQDDFKNRGLELIEYIPNKSYLFYFSKNTSIQYLKNNGVRAIVPVNGQYKLSPALKMSSFPDYALDKNNILVTLKFHKHANSNYVIKELAKHDISVKHEYKGQRIIDLAIPDNCLEELSNLSFVKWVELIPAPSVNYDNRGRGLQRSNNLDTQMPSGRNYTGEGIGVLVRDGGVVGPHIDFQGRLDDRSNDGDLSNHGDGVAGVMAGAGNLDPTARGIAAGSNIFNIEATPHFMDGPTLSLINDGSVQITNTSSGFQCQNDYTLNANTVDQQIKDIPTLLHVLSAGNTNGSDCGYGAGGQWGNLGGANKIAKNIIAAANVTFDGVVTQRSARGPAFDGRIKPDLSAMGDFHRSTNDNNRYFQFGGTSAASPATAGAAAQLYEAYGDLNNGELPQSALIKAALLNTANDVGNVGPDFIYGWGIVNALRAVEVIENENYLSDNITQGETNNHTINVPAGANQVSIMVYWSDVPGALGANPALVNDLDLVVNDPENNRLLPWVLDVTPDPVALNTPATNGADHLNNMEQVLINNPTAGDYTIDISGFNVPVGPQEYFIVYEIVSDNITVTYPSGGESFVPDETETIHWDAINTTADFDLEYSIDNGATWISITTVSSNQNYYNWNVPSSLTGQALIRVSSDSFAGVSNANFSIATQVEGFAFSQICPDGVTFIWDEITGAESYDVYLLGDKFMEVVGNSTTTSIKVSVADPTIVLWAAIVAKNDTENWTSRRTVAIRSNGGLLNCSLNNDIAINEIVNDPNDFSSPCSNAEDIVVSAIISNTGTDAQSDFELSYQLSGQGVVTETYAQTLMPGEQANYNFTTPLTLPGTNTYTLTVTSNLAGDQNGFNNEVAIDFFAAFEGTALDFEEDFEDNGILPPGWSIINGDQNLTWIELGGIIGSDGNPTTTAFINNFSYDAEGEEDFLVTEIFDLTSNAATLQFDLAKAQWNTILNDGLRVEISIDCGENYMTIYEKNDLELSTLPGYSDSGLWEPSLAEHWRTEQIDLTAYLGENAQFRFVNINGFANGTYIDNINVNQTLVSVDDFNLSNVKVYPNPASETVNLLLNNKIATDASIAIVNISGQKVHRQKTRGATNLVIDVSDYSAGLYFVTITSKGISATKKLVID